MDRAGAARLFVVQVRRLMADAGVPLGEAALMMGVAPSTAYERLSGEQKTLRDWTDFKPLIRQLLTTKLATHVEGEPTSAPAARHEQGLDAYLGRRLSEWERYHRDCSDGLIRRSPLPDRASLAAAVRPRVLAGKGIGLTLRNLYPDYPLVELWGHQSPVCAFHGDTLERASLESAVGELTNDQLPPAHWYGPELDPAARDSFERFLEKWRKQKDSDSHEFFSGPTFAFTQIHRVDGKGSLKVDMKAGRYFSSLASSEDLDHELMSALAGAPDDTLGLDALPQRKWLHKRVEDPVVDGRFRDAAVSHSTVVMLATSDGTYDIVLPTRSANVAMHAHFRHVAPSGILSPHSESAITIPSEYSVLRNFHREFLEELYGIEEHLFENDYLHSVNPDTAPEIERLDAMIQRGDATLTYTGVTVNLLFLRPEICLLLRIEDSAWEQRERAAERPLKLGWEYARNANQIVFRDREQQGHWRQPLDRNWNPIGRGRLLPSHLVPNAAGAIRLGLDSLRG